MVNMKITYGKCKNPVVQEGKFSCTAGLDATLYRVVM